jgi:hypothetical protein
MSERSHPGRSRVFLRFVGVVVAFGLTVAAAWMIALGHSQREVSLGVITGLWAALIGALTLYGGRHGAGHQPGSGFDGGAGTEVELRHNQELEMQREIAARRAYEHQLHEMVHREIETIQRVVNDQLGKMREEVTSLVGGQIRLERIETTRVIGSDIEALHNEVRQLAGGRPDDSLTPQPAASAGARSSGDRRGGDRRASARPMVVDASPSDPFRRAERILPREPGVTSLSGPLPPVRFDTPSFLDQPNAGPSPDADRVRQFSSAPLRDEPSSVVSTNWSTPARPTYGEAESNWPAPAGPAGPSGPSGPPATAPAWTQPQLPPPSLAGPQPSASAAPAAPPPVLSAPTPPAAAPTEPAPAPVAPAAIPAAFAATRPPALPVWSVPDEQAQRATHTNGSSDYGSSAGPVRGATFEPRPAQPTQAQPVQPVQPAQGAQAQPASSPASMGSDPFAGLPRLTPFADPDAGARPPEPAPWQPPAPSPGDWSDVSVNGNSPAGHHRPAEADRPAPERAGGRRRRAEGETNDVLNRLLGER